MHPVLFQIGPLVIRSYGVFVATAFLTGFWLLYLEAKRKNFYPDKIRDMELYILISGIVGARALHVLVNLDYYALHASEITKLWHGGLAIYGGLLFGIIAGWVFIVRNGMPLFATGGLVIPYIALGQSIGRIGCFFNACCFGKVAVIPALGVVFPGDSVARYPTQLYASLLLLAIFVFLKIAGQKKLRGGFLFASYLLLYAVQRFAIDFLRDDTPRYLFGFTVSQFLSIGVFAFAGAFLIGQRKWKN
ncbi:MAG: prolipoprotein diacylglyceryl transferase [Omnitrophica bacterium]|nr:prolipoprotein diacylglyceryl transferase [Candidatus Omnitrophota bacterium]